MPSPIPLLLAMCHRQHHFTKILSAYIREFHLIDASIEPFEPPCHLKVFLIFVKFIEIELTVVGA